MENHTPLNEQAFKFFHQWYDLVVLELLSSDNAAADPNWVAEKLGISSENATSAIGRLKTTGCFEELNGKIKINLENSYFAMPIPSVQLKRIHEIFMEKGLSALYEQSMSERNFESYIMSFNPEQLPEARMKIQEFISNFNQEFGTNKSTGNVYCLGMQFFAITK